DYLRLLFARVGRTYCLLCGQEVKKDTVDEVADRLLALGDGTRLNVFFPIQTHVPAAEEKTKRVPQGLKPTFLQALNGTAEAVPYPKPIYETSVSAKKSRGKKKLAESNLPSDAMRARLFDLRKRGFNRLFQNGQVFEFSTPESLLDVNFSEPVFGLVDRLVGSAGERSRIVDAVEIGYREAG